MGGSLPITAYVRTMNEASRIEAVVRRAKESCSEVLVVDSGSTDNTVALAEAAGARVIVQPWLGNGRQKRVAEAEAAHDWLLDLDADELIDGDLASALRELFASSEPEPGAYRIRLTTVPPYPKGVVWNAVRPDWRAKLYHRHAFQMPDHEAWDQLDIPAGTKVGKLSGRLLHYAFLDIGHQVTKMNRVSGVRAHLGNPKGPASLRLRILFGFPMYFFKKYIQHRYWTAGVYGFAVAAVIASNRWLRDVKMYEIYLREQGVNDIREES